MIELLVYLLVGFLQDIIIAWFYLQVSEKKPLSSSVLAFVNTVINCIVVYSLVLSPDFIWNVMCYAIGGALGTFLTVYVKLHNGINK